MTQSIDSVIQQIIDAAIKSDSRVKNLADMLAPALPALRKIGLFSFDLMVTTVRGFGTENPEMSIAEIRRNSTVEAYDAFIQNVASGALGALIRQLEMEQTVSDLFWKLIIPLLLAVLTA